MISNLNLDLSEYLGISHILYIPVERIPFLHGYPESLLLVEMKETFCWGRKITKFHFLILSLSLLAVSQG